MRRFFGLKGFLALMRMIALFCVLALSLAASPLTHTYAAATAPSLGTAGSFAVLGTSTVTNTGPTTVTGDLGVSPGTAVTGFPPGTVSGTIHAGDAVAAQAHSDATNAYNNAAAQPCNTSLTGQDLGGLNLTPGVYCFSSSAQLTGTLILNGQGDPNSVFIFQIGSTLTTASAASVSLINGAQACHVFWQVGSSATLGTGTNFMGNILALASITVTTGAASNGGLYALNGAVTLDTNVITTPSCNGGSGSGSVPPCPVSTDPAQGQAFSPGAGASGSKQGGATSFVGTGSFCLNANGTSAMTNIS